MYQSLVNNAVIPEELLWNGTPKDKIGDYDELVDVIDWELNVDPNNSAADSFIIKREGSHAIAKVPLTTIDKLTAELNLPKVDFIKMDIEGAEPNAIDGSAETLKRFKPRLSLSAYHAADHPVLVPAKVRAARGDYTMTCGPCAEISFGVRPDILYFD